MNTKNMVQGAMIGALFGCLSLLNSLSAGAVDFFIGYILALPIAWYGYHYGLKANGLVGIVCLVVTMLVGIPQFVVIALYAIVFGLFLGECLHKKIKKEIILLGGFGISFIYNYVTYHLLASFMQLDISEELEMAYHFMIENMPSLSSHVTLEMLRGLIPLVIIILSMMETYIILTFTQIIFMRLKIPFPAQFHIATYHLSKKVGLLFLIGILMGQFLNYRYHIPLSYPYYFCLLAYILEGMSYLSLLCIVKRKPLLCSVVFILVFLPYVYIIYILIGIGDIFAGMREKLYNVI